MKHVGVSVGVSVSGFSLTTTLTLTLTLLACGGTSAPPTPAGAPASLVSTADGSDDVIVAQVNGRPVWGSCVAIQAAARHLDKQAALKECVDFELMAQAAEKRGIDRDPEVALATRTALVSELVAKDYEDGITDPKQLGEFWDRATTKSSKTSLIWNVDHAEYRGSVYARVPVADGAPAADDAAAHELADKIAAACANEPGLLPPHFLDIATRVAAGVKLQTQDVPPFLQAKLDDAYGAALFAIPEVGRTSPHAVRTKWGWDVILMTEVVPASHPSEDEIVRQLMPQVKQVYFPVWVSHIERSLGVHVEIEKDAATRLEKLD